MVGLLGALTFAACGNASPSASTGSCPDDRYRAGVEFRGVAIERPVEGHRAIAGVVVRDCSDVVIHDGSSPARTVPAERTRQARAHTIAGVPSGLAFVSRKGANTIVYVSALAFPQPAASPLNTIIYPAKAGPVMPARCDTARTLNGKVTAVSGLAGSFGVTGVGRKQAIRVVRESHLPTSAATLTQGRAVRVRIARCGTRLFLLRAFYR